MTKIKYYAPLALALCGTLNAADNPHGYRATNQIIAALYGEPRFEKPWLGSIDVTAGAGATCQARNEFGNKTCLLNIYGLHNMHLLGSGVPNKDETSPEDIALTNLALVPDRCDFGKLLYNGRFSIVEANFTVTQNLVRGFYFLAHIPVRHLKIKNIGYCDASPNDAIYPDASTPAWQTFLNQFPAILQKYNLSTAPISHRGVGDLTVYAGWTYNYQESLVLDYIDTSFQFGALFPTGSLKNESLVFDQPLGYGGHWGIPFEFEAACGTFDWLTIGVHAGAIAFLKKSYCLHMKTDINQNGFIKLAQGNACVHKGILWNGGLYWKADHICRGFSALAGYSFVQQNADWVVPSTSNCITFNEAIVNSDQAFQKWNMSTVHFVIDWDFTREHMRCGPRIGAFYNLQVAGKRTYNTSVGGGTFGLDIAWQF